MKTLTEEGERLHSQLEGYVVSSDERPAVVAWIYSAMNVLEVAFPTASRHRTEALRHLPSAQESISSDRLAALLGIFKSATSEWTAGMVGTLEFHFIGMAFEDFLKHAAAYNGDGRTNEAAVLASAVLEDTISRLCKKHGIDSTGKTLDVQINTLKTQQVIPKVKAERLRSYAALRNQAFHANWQAIDTNDLRHMIEGLEEFIETHFG